MIYPCKDCAYNSKVGCIGVRCTRWSEWFQAAWDVLSPKEKENRLSAMTREQPEQDKPTTHREYVFTHILTANWRDVK